MTITKYDRVAILPKRCNRCNRLFWLESYNIFYETVGIEDYSLKQIECKNCIESDDGYEIRVPKGIWNAPYKAESDGSEDKKDCTTCIGFEDADYERWFCYDCIKGIQNHYKADKENKE